jgi:hypothetical protein
VRLTSDRLEVTKGERVRAVLIVHPSQVSVAAAGGTAHLAHELEDVGLQVVGLFTEYPAAQGWRHGRSVPAPDGLEWRLYVELAAMVSASLNRNLTEDLRVAEAWPLEADAIGPTRTLSPAAPPQPYAIDAAHGDGVLAGRLVAFGVAYPAGGEGSAS